MIYFSTTFFNLLVVLVMIIPGFIIKKLNLVSDKAVKDFSGVLLYVGMPFLIISVVSDADFSENTNWANILICVVLSVLVHFVGIGLSLLTSMGDKDKARRSVNAFASAFSNCGFIGIPLTYQIMPADIRAEALVYVAVYNIVFNFLSWMVSAMLFSSEGEKKSGKRILIKAFINPCTVGFLFALPFALCGVNLLEMPPETHYIGKFITYLANMCEIGRAHV